MKIIKDHWHKLPLSCAEEMSPPDEENDCAISTPLRRKPVNTGISMMSFFPPL
ncbi:MAG: hypothetical protein PHQ60_14405 [Sideroxydans sp.]|nr:hypothetical protein [Sideroxydans sp.]